MLHGRQKELDRLRGLVARAGEGHSAALVIRAEPGTGKTALLDAAAHDADIRVLRVEGVETEAELPFAALHLILRPLLGGLDALPQPQADALRGVLGLAVRPEGQDRFLTGLATLTLLAEQGPLLCLLDDAHWIDRASLDALLFAARRLEAEGVVLVFATRSVEPDLFTTAGLPELRMEGLDRAAAMEVLAERAPGLPPATRDRVVAESGGNPLALIELPSMDVDSLAAGPLPLPRRLQEAYRERVAALPRDTRTLLLALAAEGELSAALQATGLSVGALAPAERAGLVIDADFRHPLVRAAAYQSASFGERVAVHRALADVTSDERRARHLAAAATGPDEEVAAALEAAAATAREVSGYGEAAAALERAARLTPDPAARARRLTAAAALAADSGQGERARVLLDQSAHLGGTSQELVRLRARLEFEHGSPESAWRLLLDAGQDLLVEAARVAWSVGDAEGLRAVRDRMGEGRAGLVSGAVELLSADPGTGLDLIRRHLGQAPERRDGLQLNPTSLALLSGDFATARDHLQALAADLRSRGAIGWLPGVLAVLAEAETLLGSTRTAETTAAEALRISEDTGQRRHAVTARGLLAHAAAVRGEQPGDELSGDWAERARAAYDLVTGRWESALDRLGRMAHRPHGACFAADQVEAAVRAGRPAGEALGRYESWALASGVPWALAVRQRCLAMLADDPEEHYEQAVACSDLPLQQARSRLHYGEWLRRSRRKNEARIQLRSAMEAFEQAGAVPWADHCRVELRAAGEAVVAPSADDSLRELTPQEFQIVRLAATGATNKEIGAQLFLSPKTVGHHLYRAFPKLGVSNRTELAHLHLT